MHMSTSVYYHLLWGLAFSYTPSLTLFNIMNVFSHALTYSTKTRCIRSTDLVFRSRVIIIIFGIFNQGKTRGGFDITKVNYKICLEAHPTLGDCRHQQNLVQQNRIKSLHHNGNPLEPKRWSSPPIARSPTRARIEEHPCWLGRGTPP